MKALRDVTVSERGLAATVGPRKLQGKSTSELRHLLARAIYEVVHIGKSEEDAGPKPMHRGEGWAEQLEAVVPHRAVIRKAKVLAVEDHVHVELEGVKVRIPKSGVTAQDGRGGAPGDWVDVALPSVRPRLSPGFFAAEGSRAIAEESPIVRMYVNLRTWTEAVRAWRAALEALEGAAVGYRAKVVSHPDLLPRRDALVVYLGEISRSLLSEIATRITDSAETGEDVSVFTEQIRSGVSIAWEPADRRPGMGGLSFGEHRARAVADGIMRHDTGCGNPQTCALRASLLDAGVDPANPARNLRCRVLNPSR